MNAVRTSFPPADLAPLPGLPDSSKAIVARGLTHKFQSGSEPQWVLKGVDLDVPQGSLQLLMSPSGSGKTTLLSILAGLLTPTAGEICLLGQETHLFSKAQSAQFRLENIGFIFQEFNLFGALTALENVETSLLMNGVADRQARQQAIALLQQLGLGHRLDQLPRNLSGGEKQRVTIARALAGNPPLILADEPTAALDSRNGQQVMELLQGLTRDRQCTVLMATHDHRVTHFADRILYLEDGKIEDGKITD